LAPTGFLAEVGRTDTFKLLAIDDHPDSLTTLSAVVRDALPGTLILTATNGPAGIDQAAAEDPDVILLDIVMPGMDGFEVCRRLKTDERLKDIPVVFVTALKTDTASRVKALEAGAEAFLAKPLEPSELTAQIRAMVKLKAANRSRWMEKEQLEALVAERTRALRESEERFRLAVEDAPEAIFVQTQYRFAYLNPAAVRCFGAESADQLLGQPVLDRFEPRFHELVRERIRRLSEEKTAVPTMEQTYLRLDGSPFHVEVNAAPIRWQGHDGSLVFFREITERKQTEAALADEASRRHLLMEQSRDGIVILDQDGQVYESNRKFAEMLGYPLESMRQLNVTDWEFQHPPERVVEMIRTIDEKGDHFETRHRRRDGSTYDVEISTNAASFAGHKLIFCICRDITERKHAEVEKEKLQAQLAQAQKMESVGRLAGGVAHDFNNMLSVILGHVELAQERTGPDEALHADLQAIQRAAKSSADLTRQLLAFARKQTMAPKALDLDQTVEGMLKMLGRLIGEDIDLAWLPGGSIAPVFIDPSQVDQILANLCVNARDAIAGLGKITIETDSVSFDEAYCADHAGFVPGEFVMLAVSDDGCGMDAEIQSHLFEPFFTTKATGKGTGLGLATVYGVVKQNNGFVYVYSEPSRGTTFKIYLPRHAAQAALLPEQESAPIPAAGGETILLVEDEPAILTMTTLMLEGMGYAVIAAGTPGEAIRLARERPGRIDLLMTDVVMPEMNGRDLAGNLLSIYPDIRRLFMSGYTANVIAHHGVLDAGVHFLQKPFSKNDLAAKVREALGRE
jgi:PAS domain S-box-containing protein